MSEELQLEEQISQELVKQNVTQAVISGLKEAYGHLKIAGIEDKETYLLVKEGRKKCKDFRVLAKKICERGREDAVAIQKAWVKKQKEVTDEIAAIEDPLDEQEKAYEAAVAKEKEDRKRRHEEQLIMRQQALTAMGALYSDGSFHLGEVSFELSVVKESEPDIWEESILPKFKEEYEKVEAERIEQERIKKEQEAEFMRRELEQERKRLELEAKEAALKKAQEEQERKEREELLRIEKEAMAKKIEKWNARRSELSSFGMIPNFLSGDYAYEDIIVSGGYIESAEDNEWNETVELSRLDVQKKKAEAEQKRLAEIEAQKEAERKKVLGDSRIKAFKELGSIPVGVTSASLSEITEDEYDSLYRETKDEYEAAKRIQWEKEQEEKRQLDELKRQQELALAGDKVKWAEVMKQFDEITLYTMVSAQFKKKMGILREKLEEIKSL
jgi:hypothetical protein